MKARSIAAAALVAALAAPAHAYPHTVKQGETLASIAEHAYGLVSNEKILVAANGLDAGGGVGIVRGMRLEVPALDHYRVESGDTWTTLAAELLGDADRADVLSGANDASPWMTPAEGAEIVVPYNLRVIVGQTDTTITIAQRFLGKKESAWMLAHYNHLKDAQPKKGDVVLVPLTSLKLTEAGKADAQSANAFERSQGGGGAREAQKKAESEMPALLGEVRSGRYVDAITRGSRMLTYGELTRMEIATIHRQLVEAYVAVDAQGYASSSCRTWREQDPTAVLDPIYLSPKILAACDAPIAFPSASPSRR
jgi:LysM repeat protein